MIIAANKIQEVITIIRGINDHWTVNWTGLESGKFWIGLLGQNHYLIHLVTTNFPKFEQFDLLI